MLSRAQRKVLLKQGDRDETRRHDTAKRLHLMRVSAIFAGNTAVVDELRRRCNELGYDPRPLPGNGSMWHLVVTDVCDPAVAAETLKWAAQFFREADRRIAAASAGAKVVQVQPAGERNIAQ